MQDSGYFPYGPAGSRSSASSSRTVRAAPRQLFPADETAATGSFYMNPRASGTTESLDTLYTITQSRHGPPVPPARTSSLARTSSSALRGRHQAGIPEHGFGPPGAPNDPGRGHGQTSHAVHVQSGNAIGLDTESGLPSLQVTQPTPTKSRRYRRRSIGQESALGRESSGAWTEDTSPSERNTLDVQVDPLGMQGGRADGSGGAGSGSAQITEASMSGGANIRRTQSIGHRTRADMQGDADEDEDEDDDDDDDDDDDETGQRRDIEEARKMRAREKGRERQRRKRERDKKAREVSLYAISPF